MRYHAAEVHGRYMFSWTRRQRRSLRHHRWLCLALALLAVGCGQVTMQPTLSSSVSIEALEELGEIRRAPAHVTIFIDPELRDLNFQLTHGPAIYQVSVDRATDRVVADLMRQVRRSENLRQYLEGKRV